MTPDEMSQNVPMKRPKTCFVKEEVLGKHFISRINLSKFSAILYRKQTHRGGHFSKAARLFLQLYLKINYLICIFPKEKIFNRAGL